MKASSIILAASAALCATSAMAQSGNFNAKVLTSSKQDTLQFSKTPITDSVGNIAYQRVQSKVLTHTFQTFRNQYVLTAGDFEGKLPAGAKVTGISLDGYNNGGKTTTFSAVGVGIETCDTVPALNYTNGLNKSDTIANMHTGWEQWTIDAAGRADSAVAVINAPFTQGNPLAYTGNNLLLTLQLQYEGRNGMDYCYQKAATMTEVATVMRSGNFAFSGKGVWYKENNNFWNKGVAEAVAGYMSVEANTVPAFKLSYYTNDIYVTVRDNDGRDMEASLTLIDETTDKTLYSNINKANYTFANLDYTHTYTLAVKSGDMQKQVTGIKFGDTAANAISNDVYVELKQQISTGVEANVAEAQVASVQYVSLSGAVSNKPFDGVNVVVTTYTDGSRTAAKKIMK